MWRAMTNYLTSLCEWMAERGQRGMVKSQKLLWAIKKRKLWEAMIFHIRKRHGTYKKKKFNPELSIIPSFVNTVSENSPTFAILLSWCRARQMCELTNCYFFFLKSSFVLMPPTIHIIDIWHQAEDKSINKFWSGLISFCSLRIEAGYEAEIFI